MITQIDYPFWINAILAALTLSLAMMAFIVGVIAIWGFRKLRSDSRKAAQEVAAEHVARYLENLNLQAMTQELSSGSVPTPEAEPNKTALREKLFAQFGMRKGGKL